MRFNVTVSHAPQLRSAVSVGKCEPGSLGHDFVFLNVDLGFNGRKIQIVIFVEFSDPDLDRKDMCIFERSDEAKVGLPGNVAGQRSLAILARSDPA